MVGGINNLDCSAVGGPAEPFLREMSTAHGCRNSRRIHLPAPFHGVSNACPQAGEDGRWPVAHIFALHLQPPITPCWVLPN
ncbi:Os01g0550950 [Oryza sativa Japonica Group]|uniref:Os01g0550950 protein n=1 Tax=Oryza sativa subsp. japonica TaxID=39947 RepID=A0A0N7KD52_ORYSJ|nr:hypothetical protein EE612_003387 [Oryza sativa]BAS72649.1 Os01g0550950 [Oryza sativa Japonica Group]